MMVAFSKMVVKVMTLIHKSRRVEIHKVTETINQGWEGKRIRQNAIKLTERIVIGNQRFRIRHR